MERRYKVEARVFRALDETWYDSPWFAPWISDEVMVILRDPERREMTVSRIFEDVDSGEHRSFGPQESCILPAELVPSGPNGSHGAKHFARFGPWACEAGGQPGPFDFTVEMYEADSDFWHGFYECFLTLECGFGVVLGYQSDSAYLADGDELIGKATIAYSAEDLAATLTYVGDYAEETVTLGDCFDESGCVESPGLPTGPEYTFSWRVTRLPDRRVFDDLGPIHPIDPAP